MSSVGVAKRPLHKTETERGDKCSRGGRYRKDDPVGKTAVDNGTKKQPREPVERDTSIVRAGNKNSTSFIQKACTDA